MERVYVDSFTRRVGGRRWGKQRGCCGVEIESGKRKREGGLVGRKRLVAERVERGEVET